MANSPLSWVANRLNVTLSLGIPAPKLVAVFPWYNCDYGCGKADNPQGGVNCTHLRPNESCAGSKYPNGPYKFCSDNYSNPGYAETLPLISLGESQGNNIKWDEQQVASYINYFNATDHHFHQVWFDSPKSLALKYKWAAEQGLAGVGVWTPSATLFDEVASRAMWASVPSAATALHDRPS
jgi:di-N-acetylchitobiase